MFFLFMQYEIIEVLSFVHCGIDGNSPHLVEFTRL